MNIKDIKTIGIYAYISQDLKIVGGLEAQIYHLSNELQSRGYQVILHCFIESTFPHTVKQLENGIYTFSSDDVLEHLQLSDRCSEQIIFSFGIRDGKIQNAATQVAKYFGCKHVTFIYFTKEESDWRSIFDEKKAITSFLERRNYMDDFKSRCAKIVEDADLVIVPTEYVRGQIVSCANYNDYAKIKVCYHGIKIDDTEVVNKDKWLNLEPTFIHASRLKDPESLDKGLNWTNKFALKTNGKFFVCGNGTYKFTAKNVVQQGLLPQKELFKLMKRRCQYSLIPSQMEAGCTIALESVMCGCLPIALNMAGLAEVMKMIGLEEYLVEPKLTKLRYGVSIYEPRNISKIIKNIDTKKIKKFLTDLKNSQKIIRNKYSVEKTTDKLLNIIKEEL